MVGLEGVDLKLWHALMGSLLAMSQICVCCILQHITDNLLAPDLQLASSSFNWRALNVMGVSSGDEEKPWRLIPCSWNPKYYELDPAVYPAIVCLVGKGSMGHIT